LLDIIRRKILEMTTRIELSDQLPRRVGIDKELTLTVTASPKNLTCLKLIGRKNPLMKKDTIVR